MGVPPGIANDWLIIFTSCLLSKDLADWAQSIKQNVVPIGHERTLTGRGLAVLFSLEFLHCSLWFFVARPRNAPFVYLVGLGNFDTVKL